MFETFSHLQLVHHAKVIVHEVAGRVDAKVAGVRVAVEEARFDDLPQKGVGGSLREELLVQTQGLDPLDVGQLEGLHELHCENAGGRNLPVNLGNPHVLDALKIGREALRVRSLIQVVNLEVQQPLGLLVNFNPVAVRTVRLWVELVQQ